MEWFLSKSPQERLAMIIGSTAILLLLLYLTIWLPFSRSIDEKAVLAKKQRATLNWIESNSREALKLKAQLKPTKAANSNEALFTLIDRTAKQKRLREDIQRIKPMGSNRVQIWMEDAPFDRLMNWLGQIVNRNGITIVSINAERVKKPGRVNARIDLQRGDQ